MDDLTREQLLAAWHLGSDSIGRNARRALDAEDITPQRAAAMTLAELAAIPGLGITRRARVQEQLDRIGIGDIR